MMQRLFQFTLDFFEASPAVAHPPNKRPSSPPNKPPSKAPEGFEELGIDGKNSLVAQQIQGLVAPEIIANCVELPLQTLQQALAPATFAHPRASRRTLLGGMAVAYELRRGKRRTIGFSVGADGLTVSAPKWVPLYEIDKAVTEKSAWILKKLQETRSRHDRLESARIEWKNGATLQFLGEPIVVVLDPRHAFGGVGAELKTSTGTSPGVARLALHVGLSHSATPDQIKDAVQAWLMRQAKRIFTERLHHFAPTLQVQWRTLSLSSAGTRWGSASANGSIRLNWRLIHFKQSVIDYVVVHELSHLRVMDHSPRFWDTVRAAMPDYAQLRSQLKEEGMPRW